MPVKLRQNTAITKVFDHFLSTKSLRRASCFQLQDARTISKLALAVFFLIIINSISAFENESVYISTDKPSYIAWEIVSIYLKEINISEMEILISGSTGTYKYSGDLNNITFIPINPDIYTIHLKDTPSSLIIDTLNFTVAADAANYTNETNLITGGVIYGSGDNDPPVTNNFSEPDLMANDSSINFSNINPVENQNITIFATVWNLALRNETEVLIQFYENDPNTTGIQIGENITVNISENTSIVVNASWTAKIGNSNIFVIVDQYNNITESNETNNQANKSIFLNAWQSYYGNTSNAFVIGVSNSSRVMLWNSENTSGNLYLADSDSGISWESLQALGRNTTNATNSNTQNDFEELDLLIGMENFTDSVNLTYTQDGNPIETAAYTVYSEEINNVPQINSTNNTNFKTGILWDTSDSTNTYYNAADKQDIVFAAKINPVKEGKYGTYDYEIKIPAKLREYIAASNTVAFYYELS